jgi:putative ATP-dependent endonuclease of the OLD family
MRLRTLRIQNFRSFEDETIELDPYTALVGPNGAGKSAALQALNVFFRNPAAAPVNLLSLSDEDFHHRDVSRPVRITLTFDGLSQDAQEDFKAYYRNGALVITALGTWNASTNTCEVTQRGSRMVMKAFAPFFEALSGKASAGDLKTIFAGLAKVYPDLPKASTKADMEAALREYETTHPNECELLDSDDQFYGWSKGENRLRKYLQWIYVPAVKDTSTEQDEGRATALGQLLERTVRSKVDFATTLESLRADVASKYGQMIEKEQEALTNIGVSLTKRIQAWTHTGTQIRVGWHYDPEKSITLSDPRARMSVGEDAFLGEVARLGHGLQRTVFVSLLQELAEEEGASGPTLLLGFEEPELYQHPPQARHMSNLLEELATKGTQVVLTTHSPYFVSGKGCEHIRMIRKSTDGKRSMASRVTHKDIAARLSTALKEKARTVSSTMASIEQIMQPSQNELYFAGVVVLVEGLEDVAFISTYLHLSNRWSEFRRHGCHFVIAAGKGPLSRPLAIAQGLGIPVFVVFDSDATANRTNPAAHIRDNGCILSLCGHQQADAMPEQPFWADNVVMWHSNICDVVRTEIGSKVWDAAEQNAKEECGFLDGVTRKNALLIAATLDGLYEKGIRSETLARLGDCILGFAERN